MIAAAEAGAYLAFFPFVGLNARFAALHPDPGTFYRNSERVAVGRLVMFKSGKVRKHLSVTGRLAVDFHILVLYIRFKAALLFSGLLCQFWEPMTCLIAERADRKHHGDFHEHADNCGQGGAGVGAKQCDGDGNREFEKVAGANERARRGDVVFNAEDSHEQIG